WIHKIDREHRHDARGHSISQSRGKVPMTGHRLRSAGRVAATIIPWVVLSPSVAGALEPQQVDQHFQIDPVTDTVLTGGGLGFDALLGLILSTGEIKANVPPTGNDKSMLLPIDRLAVDQRIDPNAS